MRFDAIQSNFTAGELSPKLWGRVELEKYLAGLGLLENMIVKPAGGADKRGGSHYVATVKDSTKNTILVEFNYQNQYAYTLEFGDLYMRVYVNRAQVAGPYELATTYTSAELADLRFSQDSDTLYITHKDHYPAKLTRTAHNSWTLADVSFEFGYNYDHEWVSRTAAAEISWESVCWSPELSIFCAVGWSTSLGNRVMTSPDGITWTDRTAPSNYWNSVCWSPELTLFCAVAFSGTGNRVMTSPDGITWTSRTSAADNEWMAVCWSSALSLFIAVAGTGTNNRVMTSPNGITWTSRTSAADNEWMAVCWSPELSLLVAVAGTGTGNRVMTSSDGFVWTIRTSAADNPWFDVCWSPEIELFVTVAPLGTSDRVMTSPDGFNWTCRNAAAENSWRVIRWVPELELFIALASSGALNRIMTSSDGVTWTIRTAPTMGKWTSLCWSKELAMIAAVSLMDGSVEDFVMTSSATFLEWVANDYPTISWFYEQRFLLAATVSEPNGVWGSRSAEYTNLKLGTGLDNEALKFVVAAAYKFLWASPGQEILLGGANAEFKLSANALNEALTPSNVRPVLHTSYGSSFLPPARIDDSVVFVQRGARKLRRLVSDFQSGNYSTAYKANDVTILSDHIAKSGVIDLTHSTTPDSVIWACRTDGVLIGLTYEPEHNVFAWHRHFLGGTNTKVKSVAAIEAVEGMDKDELWMVVERTIDGSTVSYVEYINGGLDEEDDIEDAFYVDSGITQTGSDFTVVTGLDHLEGETVQVLADGLKQTSKVVASGQITIDTAADKAQVGLQYTGALETLPIEGGNPIGTAQTLIKRIKNTALRLHRSLGFKLGNVHGDMDAYSFTSSALFTGDTDPMPFAGGYDRQSRLRITNDDPLPLNILAIIYRARTE